jgi:hypothetical protein
MNLRTLLIAGGSALFGLCLALVIVSSASAQLGARAPRQQAVAYAPPSGAVAAREPMIVGRFKLKMIHGLGVCLYDTTTGDCWYLKTDGAEKKWVGIGW